MQMLDLTPTPVDLPDYVCFSKESSTSASQLFSFGHSASHGFDCLDDLADVTRPDSFRTGADRTNGLPFRMYKFRTMKICKASESDTCWTTEGDPRRTHFGTFLRKTSLDELPQFINVLKGDMSVVGTAARAPAFCYQIPAGSRKEYNRRHCLRVGITGWAQVNGWRGDTSIEKRVEYDLYYLQNWTFGFDLRIILLTIFSALIGRNAY